MMKDGKTTCTTTILNSSEISDMKVEICFMSLSTEDSFPVLSNVVMANVAMERFTSVIRFSRSKLHAVTAAGWRIATSIGEPILNLYLKYELSYFFSFLYRSEVFRDLFYKLTNSTLFNVLTAANLRVGFGELRKS